MGAFIHLLLRDTDRIAGLLTLIALFVRLCFCFIRLTLFRIQGLPFLPEDLSDLAYENEDAD